MSEKFWKWEKMRETHFGEDLLALEITELGEKAFERELDFFHCERAEPKSIFIPKLKSSTSPLTLDVDALQWRFKE